MGERTIDADDVADFDVDRQDVADDIDDVASNRRAVEVATMVDDTAESAETISEETGEIAAAVEEQTAMLDDVGRGLVDLIE